MAAKIGTLVDNFSAPVLNASIWTNVSVGVARDSTFKRVGVQASPSYPGLGSGTWDATASAISARIITEPVGDGSPTVFLELKADSSNYTQISLGNNQFRAAVWTAGSPTFITLATYSQITHLYWRIRESSGTFYYDTSPDGSNWTNLGSLPYTWNATSVYFWFIASCDAASQGPLYGYISDVNTVLGIDVEPAANPQYAYMTLNLCDLTMYDTLTIQRTNPDGSIATVRSANSVATGNAEIFSCIDYEAPLGANVTYTATGTRHNSDGSTTTGQGSSAPAQIPVNPGTCWLKSLLQPTISTQVQVQTLSDVKRAARSQSYDVIGRKNSVVVSDVRGGRAGTLTLMTTASTDLAALKTLLDPGGVLFIQFTPADGFDDLYFVPGEVTIKRPSATSTDFTRLWDVVFTEVDTPSGVSTSLPNNSYLAVTSFGTYQALLSDRSSYLAVLNTAYGSGPGGV